MGGSLWRQSARIDLSEGLSAASHGGASTRTFPRASSFTKAWASGVRGPDRDSKIKFRAPRLTSHRAIARPRPPSPPQTTNVAFAPNS
ncbi:putative polyketide synthase [Rosellinia necatrix]|uniref:Putative polyketide synthase n=1 Tax=Rosellinia necatrix TaxID=77044 RepID=A0A1S8A9U2_ROSNE|nr:putative polyketide synthase [Rosellinia necatrix]